MFEFFDSHHSSTNPCFCPHEIKSPLFLPLTAPNNPKIIASPIVVFPDPTGPDIFQNPFNLSKSISNSSYIDLKL